MGIVSVTTSVTASPTQTKLGGFSGVCVNSIYSATLFCNLYIWGTVRMHAVGFCSSWISYYTPCASFNATWVVGATNFPPLISRCIYIFEPSRLNVLLGSSSPWCQNVEAMHSVSAALTQALVCLSYIGLLPSSGCKLLCKHHEFPSQ